MASDTDVRLHVYRTFVKQGSPPSADETAGALGITPEEAAASYRRLHGSHAITLDGNTLDVWLANPLSAKPTNFRVETTDGRWWWGTCAWDALGVLTMLGSDGRVTTTCPDCREELVVVVRDGELEREDAVAHFVVPALSWWDDIEFT